VRFTVGAPVPTAKATMLYKYTVVGADKLITVDLKSLNPTPALIACEFAKKMDAVAARGKGAMATVAEADDDNPAFKFVNVILPVPPIVAWYDNDIEKVPAGKLIGMVFLVPETTPVVVCVYN